MTFHDLSRLMIKFLGLFIIATTISYIPFLIDALRLPYDDRTLSKILLLDIAPLVAMLLIGLLLFRADTRIANAIIFVSEESDSTSNIDYLRIESMLIALLGLYLAVTSLQSIAGYLIHFLFGDSAIGFVQNILLNFVRDLAVLTAKFLLGASLVLGSNGLTLWRHRFLNIRNVVQTWDADK